MKLLDKSIVKEIVVMGVPSFLETLFTTFTNVIDSKMVSTMGVTAISAVSVTNSPRLFVLSVFIAFNTVLTSVVAKFLGKNDQESANRCFDAVIKVTVVLSMVLGILCVLLARPIMWLVAHQEDTLDDSATYFSIVMGGMIFNTLFLTINAGLRGCGHTKITFISNIISCVVNIFCNYLLIGGHLGFPALGIKGAAIATVAGTVVALFFVVGQDCRPSMFVNIPYCAKKMFKHTLESTKEMREMARSTLTDGIVTRISLLIIGSVIARIGSYQMAVYSLGMNLLNVNQALGTGFQTAGVALIGRAYGTNDKKQTNEYKNTIIILCVASSIVLALIIAVCGRTFYGFFSEDPKFIQMGATSCLFISVITLSQTMKFALTGCLQGVGAMKEVMRASIVSFAFVNLGFLVVTIFILGMGIWGAWVSSLVSQTVQASMLWYFIKQHDAFRLN